jgi:hypothetical protein
LAQGRNVYGPHRFVAITDCQVCNGMLRVTAGAGSTPTLVIEAWRPAVTVGDVFVDTFSDVFGGGRSDPEWVAVGTLTLDSPTEAALLTSVFLSRISAEAITLHLVIPAVADAWVTLRRGERQVRIQHGSSRPPLATVSRRLRWTDSPSPVGIAAVGRVQEDAAAIPGFYRYVGAIDPVATDGGTFSIATPAVNFARMGAGVGMWRTGDTTGAIHAQLSDASRPVLVVS